MNKYRVGFKDKNGQVILLMTHFSSEQAAQNLIDEYSKMDADLGLSYEYSIVHQDHP